MKLKLPDNTIMYLDVNLPLEKKKKIVNNILNKYHDYFFSSYTYVNKKGVIDEVFSWEKNRVKTILDILGTFLCKEKKFIHDKEILSKYKYREMIKGGENYISFSQLPLEQKILLGVLEYANEKELNDYKNGDTD